MIPLLSIKAEMARKDELLKCHELPICHKPTINSHSMLHDWRGKHAFLQCTENKLALPPACSRATREQGVLSGDKNKGSKLSPQGHTKHRIDPEAQGNLRNHLLPLSRDFPSQCCSRPSTKGYTTLGPTVYDLLPATERTGA